MGYLLYGLMAGGAYEEGRDVGYYQGLKDASGLTFGRYRRMTFPEGGYGDEVGDA